MTEASAPGPPPGASLEFAGPPDGPPQSAPDGAPQSAAEPSADAPRSAGRVVLSGGSWALLPQVTSLLVNLALTPFVLHGLGVDRYGLFLFAASLSQFVSTFDGGITASASRFLSTLAGAKDTAATTRLVCTLTLVATGFGAIVFGILWVIAPPVTAHLHMPVELRTEGIFLLRTLGVLLAVALARNVVATVLVAYQRFVYLNVVSSVLYAEYVIGLVLTVHHHWGLQGVAWTLVGQQIAVTLLITPAALPYLRRRSVGLYRPAELRRFLSYSGKLQLVGLANLFLQEADVLLIGAVLPIRDVSIYSVGANFAFQLRLVPANALQPVLSVLGQSLGRSGREAMLEQFRRIQRFWVQAVSGWCIVGAAAVGFGVTAWLGDGFEASGVVGALVLVGNLFYLGPAVLNLLMGLLDRPGIEARFSGVMVAANVALTVPLVFAGPIGVAAATGAGQLVAALWLVRRVRRELDLGIDSFLSQIPLPACLVSAGAVVAMELALRPFVPHGPGGLLLSGVPAGIGLLLYAVLVLGPSNTRTLTATVLARVRRRPAPRGLHRRRS